MGKHTLKLAKQHPPAAKSLVTATAIIGLLLSNTPAAFAGEQTQASIQDTAAQITSHAFAYQTANQKSLPIMAPKDAVVTFSRATVSSSPAPKAPEPPTPAAEKTTPEATVAEKATNTPVTPQRSTQAPPTPPSNVPAPTATGSLDTFGDKIVAAAIAQVGTNQDCTMLVTNSLKAVGINFRDWPIGYQKLGTIIPASEAKAGDLVYYLNNGGGTGLSHIAVYTGIPGQRMVHGGWSGNQTVMNDFVDIPNASTPIFIRINR